MTSGESYFTTVFPLLTKIWTRWFLILIKPSIWLWPGSVEATLMLLQSNPQFWRNYQRKEKLFLHNQPSPGQHAFHVVGQEELCSLPFLCPPQIVQLRPPSITQASGHSWISWITAGKCSIAISPVLLTWCYYLMLLVAAGITISADWRDSGGRQDGLTDVCWNLGSGANHGKNERVWELLIKHSWT